MAVRWGNKLGRRCLALLNIKMYYACSLAKRKRDAPTYEDSFSSIVVDENNAVKASSKLLKLFIFFWDLNLDAATEERIDKSTAFTEAEENKFLTNYVTDVQPGFASVLPGSGKVFGKIVYEKNSGRLFGASFFGGREVEGFGNLISALIKLKQPAGILAELNYNYTPPLSPLKNLPSTLGNKIIRNKKY